jgi:hypothetical protein
MTKEHSSRPTNNKEQPHAKRQPTKVKKSDTADPGDDGGRRRHDDAHRVKQPQPAAAHVAVVEANNL